MKKIDVKTQTKTKKSETKSRNRRKAQGTVVQVQEADKGPGIFQMAVSDFTFKKVFGMDNPEDFLLEFLNCVLEKYVGRINSIEYLPTELRGIVKEQRGVNFDIYCKTDRSERILVEMQRAPQKDFSERAILNMSRAISNASRRGSKDYRITAFYSINILDFELSEYKNDDKDCIHVCHIKNEKNEILTPKVGLFFINLCNFASQQPEVSNELKHWLYVLKNMHLFDEEDYAKQEGIFRKLMDECRMDNLTTAEMKEYKKSILDYEDMKKSLAYVDELAYNRGVAEGVAKGIAEGEARGEARGEAKGKSEGLAEGKLQIARTMLSMGLDTEIITKATGLPEEDILKLRN